MGAKRSSDEVPRYTADDWQALAEVKALLKELEGLMPVHKTPGGYKYGTVGKTYKSRKQAEKQAAAIRASQRRSGKKVE